MLWTKLPQEVQDIQKLLTKQRALIQCLRQSLAEVLQVPQETLITHLTDKTNHSPRKTIYSPRIKTVLMSQVERKEPAINHQRLEEELTPKEIMEIRQTPGM